MKSLFLFFFILSISVYSFSATISKERYANSDLFFITLSGDITQDDAAKFANAVTGVGRAIVVLDSPGGSVVSGIEIGRRIKSNNFVTAVPGGTLCASSCALIWLAGAKRFAENNSFIGFHAAYVYKNGRPVESGVGNALVGSYLNALGMSDAAVIYITNAPPEGIERLNRIKGEQVGISYASINDNTYDAKERRDISVKKSSYDPVGTVTRFYKALSAADGDTASALVVPEKRGIGPFNEKNMSSFYGNMRVPLSIQTVKQLDSNTVEVHYTYTYTKTQCNGIATVATEYFLGNTLIKGIKANC